MKLRNKILTLLLVTLILLLTGCKKQEYKIQYFLEGELFQETSVFENELADNIEVPSRRNCIFSDWYIDNTYQNKYNFNTPVDSNLTLYGKYLEGYLTINFYNEGVIYDTIIIKEGEKFETIPIPSKKNYIFDGWFADEELTKLYNFNDVIFSSDNVYAKWHVDPDTLYTINYVLPEYTWLNKDDLYEDFYGDFYNFLVNNTDCNMSRYETLDKFLTNCKTWKVGNRDNLYHTGDNFGSYYVTKEIGGKVQDQPTDTFIGYCYQNDMYLDVIDHLITFFAYWRTDEGYTGGPEDPDNLGNDFFAIPWASMVDTSKFFYFTSDTLNNIYSWFNSERVKHALDYIPGVMVTELNNSYFKDETYTLPSNVEMEGYTFNGFYLDSNYTQQVLQITPDMINNDEITIYVKVTK